MQSCEKGALNEGLSPLKFFTGLNPLSHIIAKTGCDNQLLNGQPPLTTIWPHTSKECIAVCPEKAA